MIDYRLEHQRIDRYITAEPAEETPVCKCCQHNKLDDESIAGVCSKCLPDAILGDADLLAQFFSGKDINHYLLKSAAAFLAEVAGGI